jgi:hypothetical protein
LRFATTGTIIAGADRARRQARGPVPAGSEGRRVVQEKDAIGSLLLGGVMGVLALVGLLVAAGAQDGAFYATGLGLFVFCVLFIFAMIYRQVGR